MRRAAIFEPDTGGAIEIVTDEVKGANEEHLRLWFAHVRFAISGLNPSEKADLFFVPSEFTRSWLELEQESTVGGTEIDMEFYTWGRFLCQQLLRTCKLIMVPVWAQCESCQNFTLLCISKLESDEFSIRYYDFLHKDAAENRINAQKIIQLMFQLSAELPARYNKSLQSVSDCSWMVMRYFEDESRAHFGEAPGSQGWPNQQRMKAIRSTMNQVTTSLEKTRITWLNQAESEEFEIAILLQKEAEAKQKVEAFNQQMGKTVAVSEKAAIEQSELHQSAKPVSAPADFVPPKPKAKDKAKSRSVKAPEAAAVEEQPKAAATEQLSKPASVEEPLRQ